MIDDRAAKAARGRPSGQPEAVAADFHRLQLHDLALLRAVVQGMDPAAAVLRYLPDLTADARVARGHLVAVARDVRAQLVGLGHMAMADALWQATERMTGNGASAAPSPSYPTLEEFAETLETDMYSERELAELYEEQYGHLTNVPGAPAINHAALVQQALSGIALVQSSYIKVPAGDDALELWLSDRLCRQLRGHGILLVRELVFFINRYGRNWFNRVCGLGRIRSKRLVQWLIDHEQYTGAELSQRMRGVVSVAPDLAGAPASAVPVVTLGLSLRGNAANALGADSDRQALQAWASTLDLKSQHTRQAYLRDVNRLMLWARERGKGLSTLTVEDAVAHAQFLIDPPAHWVNPLPTSRSMSDWRPMRGPLTAASANRALAAIGNLYGFFVESGYLVANPFVRVRSVGKGDTMHDRLDTSRSFSAHHLNVIRAFLSGVPDTIAKRRLVAIMMLAETTGMRRFELAGHTWGDLKALHRDGDGTGAVMGLSVRGKGNTIRVVPVRPTVIEALERHRSDRETLVRQGVLAEISYEATPLISIIEPTRLGRQHENGGLSGAGIYRVLKTFFKAVSKHCDDEQLQADFVRASCHWLRHTFAHEVLKASGNDLPVTQQLLGHKSINTTGIYLKADMDQRIEAVMAMPDRFHSLEG